MSDLISRQVAINICTNSIAVFHGQHRRLEEDAMVAVRDKIKNLPAAEQKRETTTISIGRSKGSITMWYKCDECGEPVDKEDAFCRRCGRGIIHE